jgi:hypothetical protein
VTDLAPACAAETPYLADRERREVVVMHEPLVLLGRERVQLLLHAHRPERDDAQYLRLTALE